MNDISKYKDLYIKTYKKYLQDPIKNIKEMSNIIISSYKFSSLWTEDLFIECRKNPIHNKTKYVHEHTLLKTNGSTKLKIEEYKWGPNFRIICDSIWYSMHKSNYEFKDRYWIVISKINEIKTGIVNEGVVLYINPDKHIDINIDKSVLIMFPHTLATLIDSKHFIDFVIRTNSIISITGLDSSFYDFNKLKELSIPLINQMRSWKEGTAFYTCPYGIKHWMENLFYCTNNKKTFDLFNFHNNWWNKELSNTDNIWPLEEFKLCKCGTWYREMNFQPHAMKWFYDYNGNISSSHIPFAEKLLRKKYNNFQVIQKSNLNNFEIYVDSDVLEKDIIYIKSSIKKIFKSENFNIEIINGIYEIGRNKKIPVFWSEYEKDYQKKQFKFKSIV